MHEVRLTLPWPPTVNGMFVTIAKGRLAGRTLLSERGRKYRGLVNDQVTLQRVQRHLLTGKLAVEIVARPPDRRARDLDNLLKAILDGLVKAAVIDDDAHIDDLRIRRGATLKGGELDVRIEEIPGEATESAALFAAGA